MATLGILYPEHKNEGSAVVLRVTDAYKSYGSFQALAGVNLTVYPGTIYALLGPSGCGKTTLMNSIVGRSDLDYGSIVLSFKDLKDIGFMPQEISLFMSLNIAETMRFYGYLYRMGASEIKRRLKYLSDMLDLPPTNRCASTLSGGQQRRVSLAVALLHDPKVLILDEPTVGLDPLLSKSLWERLKEMSMQGKTIILTTHYIEEARQADMIGLMRKGRMLTENSPAVLLQEHNTEYLEDVFLSLCYKDNESSNDTCLQNRLHYSKSRTFDKPERISIPRIKAQLWKNLHVSKRNFMMTIFGLMLPVVMDICTRIAFAHNPYQLPLAIVNEEFEGSVLNCPQTFTNSCILSNPEMMASCVFINDLKDRYYKLTEYSNYEAAVDAHRQKLNRAIVHFPSNFTESLSERFLVGVMGADVALYESGTVDILLDAAEVSVKEQMQSDFAKALEKMMKDTVEICTDLVKPGSLASPVQLKDPIFGDKSWNLYVGLQLGMSTVGILFCSMIFSAATILDEKQEGSLDRVLSAGVSMYDVMIAHIIQHSISALFYGVETYLLLYVFDSPYKGNPWLIFTVCILTGLTGVFIGGAMGLVTEHLIAVVNAAAGCNFAFVCLTGLVWPLEGAHESIRNILPYLPVTSTIKTVRDIALKGYGLSTPMVARGFAQVALLMISSLIFEIIVIRTRKGAWNAKK